MSKKKYFMFLFVLLFIMLFATCSTCYASISQDFVDYTITTLDQNGSWGSQNTSYHNGLGNLLNDENKRIAIQQNINTALSNNSLSYLTERNCIVLTAYNSSSNLDLIWTFSNVSAGDDTLGYLMLSRSGSSDIYGSYDGKVYEYRMTLNSNGSYSFSSFRILNNTSNAGNFWPGSPTFTTLDNAYILTMSNIASGSASNQVWCTRPWQSGASMTYAFIHDKSENGGYVPPTPPEPEPPQDTTGTITNSSGETTGSIDLSGIQNGITDVKNQISGDTQKVITNQNENTDKLIQNQNQIAQQQHEDLTTYNTDNVNDLNDTVNDVQAQLSGDLSNSEIFGALNTAEKGFFDIITGEASDFIISWDDIRIDGIHNNDNKVLNHASGSNFSSLNGSIILNTSSNGVIIPAGQINFSKACRENAVLGKVKTTLNIILSALCAFALFKYLYNLILATLGIDNQFLYEKNEDGSSITSTYNVNTGQTTYSGTDVNGKKFRWTTGGKK